VPDAMTAQPETFAGAEVTAIAERVVVAPRAGRFVPLPPEVFTAEGEWVEPGQVLARITQGDKSFDVDSPFRGWMMGMLALPGQPVRSGEALFWIWSG
jgi:biotin carboxyl carrier protein